MANNASMDYSLVKYNTKHLYVGCESCASCAGENNVQRSDQSAATLTPYSTCTCGQYPTQDTSTVNSYKDMVEGHEGVVAKEINCANSRGLDVSLCGSLNLDLAKTSSSSCKRKTKMERVSDHSPYSSDNWEDSDHSDTDSDHSDSSDDDDPKSQVDRLIERGTLMFMDDENSALSSESGSDDSDYDNDDADDSESDITDVSPIMSATASPIGLSPVLARRILTTSPLALHNHPSSLHGGKEDYHEHNGWAEHNHHLPSDENNSDSTNMALLMKAVLELEKKGNKKQSKRRANDFAPTNGVHPIHDSPHHRHLSRKHISRRKNMSFSNDEVRRIDHDNKILLKKIMAAHRRSKHPSSSSSSTHHSSASCVNSQNHTTAASVHTYYNYPRYLHHYHHRPANATINRRKDDEKIRRDNLILLRKIQEARPSREVVDARSPRHRYSGPTYVRSGNSMSSGGSCSLSARTHHATSPPPRKETAL